MMSFDPTLVRYSEAQSQQFFQQVAERARAVPGVTSVTMTTSIPMSNDSIGFVTIAPEGFQFPDGQGERHGALVDGGRALFRHDGRSRSSQGRNFTRRRRSSTRRAWPSSTSNSRSTTGRIRIRSASGSCWTTRRRRGSRSSASRRPASTSSSPSRRRTSSTCRTARRKPQRMIMVAQSAGDPSALSAPLREVVRGLDVESADLQRPDDGGVLPDARGQHLQRAGHDRRRDGR